MYSADAAERFWSKVERGGPSDCWLWRASTHRPSQRHGGSYGHFGVNGRIELAHRVSYELASGQDIPRGLCICHRCDTPQCVNPSHLFVGTHLDNRRDSIAKGRAKFPGPPRGHLYSREESNGNAKLTADMVRAIRTEYARGGVSQIAIAERYGINQTSVSAICRRRTWPDLT